MSKISKELLGQMLYYIPESLVKHQIRLYSTPQPVRLITCDDIIAAMPRKIMLNHVPVRLDGVVLSQTIEHRIRELTTRVSGDAGDGATDSFVQRLEQRQGYLEVCELVQDKSLGFRFPGWREAKFARELKSDWLVEDGKRLYEYLAGNDLRPGFSQFYRNHDGKWACRLFIRWQGNHFDKALNLRENALFAHVWKKERQGPLELGEKIDFDSLARHADEVERIKEEIRWQCDQEFHRDMNDECELVARAYIGAARAAIARAAAEGEKTAEIFSATDGVAYSNVFGENLHASGGQYYTHYRNYHLFDRPMCYGGVVARGLCLWALEQDLKFDIRIHPWSPSRGNRGLRLVVSWGEE